MAVLRRVLAWLVCGYLGLAAAVWMLQTRLLYLPTPARPLDPASQIELPVADTRLRLTVRPWPGSQALIYLGGNGEDVAWNLPELAQTFPQHALFLLHYRGYAGSSGSPDETALHADALALYDHVQRSHPQITVIGRSLGSGIAVRLASQRELTRLVLVTPYDSIVAIAARHFWYLPVSWLLHQRYESWRHAPLVQSPTLLILAEHDSIIPRANSENLLRHFRPGVARMAVISGADHNSISADPAYWQWLAGKAE